jgi:hypothetical protein
VIGSINLAVPVEREFLAPSGFGLFPSSFDPGTLPIQFDGARLHDNGDFGNSGIGKDHLISRWGGDF